MIILCFLFSDDHQHSFSYPSLKEEDLHSSCVIDIDPILSPQPIQKDDVCIQVLPESDRPCNYEDDEIDLSPFQILSPIIITTEICNQPVETHFHPTEFQSRIRERSFKPLRLSSTLHPYPPNFFKYLPLFTAEDHVIMENHLESFHNFIDNLEIVHEDIVMRIFSKSFAGNVGF